EAVLRPPDGGGAGRSGGARRSGRGGRGNGSSGERTGAFDPDPELAARTGSPLPGPLEPGGLPAPFGTAGRPVAARVSPPARRAARRSAPAIRQGFRSLAADPRSEP